MLKVSIIIPIYNVEEYLEQCINSAIEQTMKETDYEIILIDNGSKDTSTEIAERYKNTYDNVILVTYKNNRTICPAINMGLKLAQGKYVYILHSDDIIDSTLLETCYKKMEEHELEVLYFGYKVMYDSNEINYPLKDGTEVISNKIPENKILTGVEVLQKDIWLGPEFIYFFNKKFLDENKIYFNENVLIEDMEFMPRLFMKTNKFMKINKILHLYRIRKNNISNINNSTNLKNMLEGVKVCIDVLLQFVTGENFKEQATLNVLKEYFFYEFNSAIMYMEIIHKDELEEELLNLINRFVPNYIKVFRNEMTEKEYEFFYKIARRLFKDASIKNLNNYSSKLNNVVFDMMNNSIKKIDEIKRNLLKKIPLDNSCKKIGIYGIGGHTKSLLEYYEQYIGQIKAEIIFIDSFKGYENEEFMNKQIINVNEANKYNFECCIISSFSFEQELYDNLNKVMNEDMLIYRFYEKINCVLFG